MLITTLAVAALMPLAAARAPSCPIPDSECKDIFDADRCHPGGSGGNMTCPEICTNEYMNKRTTCLQCELNNEYRSLWHNVGDSSYFADAEANLVNLHSKCVVYGTVPTPTASLTEPPLRSALPTDVVGRPRSCERLCYDAGRDSFFRSNKDIAVCYTLEPLPEECEYHTWYCSTERFNKLAECAQCLLISASRRDWSKNSGQQAYARRRLDELSRLCSEIGQPVTNVSLYTQFPVPTNTQLALSATPTKTFTRPANKSTATARVAYPAYAAPAAAAAAGLYIMV